MATYVDRVETSVVRYEPGPLPENVEDLGGNVVSELKRLGDIILNLRHVDTFKWSDGIWTGVIGPYNILDLFYTYFRHVKKLFYSYFRQIKKN